MMTVDTRTSTELKKESRRHRLQAWLAEWPDIQWRWVFLSGAAVMLLNIVVIGVIISLYATVVVLQLQSQEEAAIVVSEGSELIGIYLSPIVHFFATILVAFLVARRQGTAVSWYGLLIGIASGIAAALQAAIFSGAYREVLLDATLITFFPLPILGSLIGARRSQAALAGQQRLFRASQAVGHAGSPQQLVTALGENLAAKNVSLISLWEILLQDERGRPLAISQLASWSPQPVPIRDTELQLDTRQMPVLAQLETNRALQVKALDLPDSERALWVETGTRSMLLIPLLTPLGEWVGLLTVSSAARGGFGRSAEQDYVTIAAQVALVLDNMRLVAQAKETAVLQERQRLAREIHDTLAQGFTSIVMHLEAAEQGMPHALDVTRRHLNQARQTARDNLGQARRVVDDLRPELLESRPLDEALGRAVQNWSLQTSIAAQFQVTGSPQKLHPQVEVTLLRAVQEALSNIRKHAGAAAVTVTLSYLDDLVILDVQDDGVGLAPVEERRGTAVSGGFGLIAMRERVVQLGGELVVESERNEGSTLMVSIPVQNKEEK